MIFEPSKDAADITEEVLGRTRQKLWARRDVGEEQETALARAIARTHGKNPALIPGEAEERDYKAGMVTLTNPGWLGTGGSADAVTRASMPLIRARARDAEENNPYAERYLAELESNVLGPEGISLQMQIMNFDPAGERLTADGKKRPGALVLDEQANDIIETAWLEWKGSGICDVSGELSWHECERLALRSTARDGDVLLRLVRDWGGNEFGFAVQLIEGDALDHNYNASLPNGNVVIMGVEMDQWRRRVAYHILKRHPGDFFIPSNNGNGERRERVDARDIIHLRFMRRIGQTRGVSWLAPVLDQLEMLRGYEEAELIAARSEACKGGFFYSDIVPEGGFSGAPPDPAKLVRTMKLSPAQMRSLPYGVKYQEVNPTHPNGNYSNYRSGVLRGIASGIGVSYNILANDLVGVNYSSLRGGLLDEREIYKMIQSWIIQRLELRVFAEWLESAIIHGKLKGFTMGRFKKYNAPYFQGRRWDWVDPLKDVEAIEKAISAGLTSRRAEVAKKGGYIADVAREQAADKALAELNGLTWGEPGEPAPDRPEVDPQETPEAPETPETPEAPEPGLEAENIQGTALNGAQVASLLEIINAYTTAAIPKTTAAALIAAAFPAFGTDKIEQMLKDIVPKEPAAPQNPPKENPPDNPPEETPETPTNETDENDETNS